MLVKSGQSVEDGTLADIGISGQRDGNSIIHTDAPIHNYSLMIRYENRSGIVPGLLRKNYATGNHRTGISRRLRGKTISARVDDNGTSDDILHTEPFIIEGRPGIALVAEQYS